MLNEIDELNNRGHNIIIFSLREGNKDILHDEYNDLDITEKYMNLSASSIRNMLPEIDFLDEYVNTLSSTISAFPVKITGINIIISNCLINFIQDLECDLDIIHGHFANSVKIAQICVSSCFNIPSVVTAHAYEIFSTQTDEQIRYICNNMDHIFVPSEYNREYLRDKIGVKNSFTKVPATTRVNKFNPTNETISGRILTVGRLSEKKGHVFSIDAVANLIDRGYDLDYHIIGTGDKEKILRERVFERGIQDSVKFLGHVSDDRLNKELSQASVFVLPCVIASNGDRDAMPVVLKEAMACETACVSTTISAIPELISDKQNGLMVPPGESDSLTDAIRYLLDNPKERKRLAKNGLITVKQKFDISASVNLLEKDFENIVCNRRNNR
nr:glycosyltransferase family 4 protein [Haloarcula californiae]